MIKNYFKTAHRNLTRNKAYTLLNVLGLKVGIAACLLIFLVIRYETSFDNFHAKKKNIYRVASEYHTQDGIDHSGAAAFPTAPALRIDFPQIKKVACIFRSGNHQVTMKDVVTKEDKLEHSGENIEISTSGGSINASHCRGKLRLGTSGGSLHLEDLEGDIRANTSGGSIDGNNITGELISHTSGGSIHLTNLSGSLETSTSGGSINVSIISIGKYVKINNSAGNVELNLPKSVGLNLNLSTNKIKTEHLENFSGKMDDDEVKVKLNGGGVPVTVNAGSGKIVLGLK